MYLTPLTSSLWKYLSPERVSLKSLQVDSDLVSSDDVQYNQLYNLSLI